MKIIILLLLVILQFTENSARRSSTTLKLRDRIRILKSQIRNSLRNPSPREDPPVYYESDENAPIKPILDDDELKKDDKFKLRKLKTGPTFSFQPLATHKYMLRTKPTPKIRSTSTHSYVPPKFLRHNRTKPNLKIRLQDLFNLNKFTAKTAVTDVLTHTHTTDSTTALDVASPNFDANIFYRRTYDKSLFDNAQEWMHCSEHVTPYLKGVKKELTRPNKIKENHDLVYRLFVLLSANTTRMTRAEKKTTMYQISKLKIRLYSWSEPALSNLTRTISKLHSRTVRIDFSTIQKGLIKLLASWQADMSDQTVLLKYASVFRPPCIPRGDKGSSKFVRGSTVKTSTPQRMLEECVRRDGDDNCVE